MYDEPCAFDLLDIITKETFLVSVVARNINTVLPRLRLFVYTNTSILITAVSELWVEYNSVSCCGHKQLKVCHTLNFVTPMTHATINNVVPCEADTQRGIENTQNVYCFIE